MPWKICCGRLVGPRQGRRLGRDAPEPTGGRFHDDAGSEPEIVACGRTRWKIENAGFNVMKITAISSNTILATARRFLAMMPISKSDRGERIYLWVSADPWRAGRPGPNRFTARIHGGTEASARQEGPFPTDDERLR